MNITTLIVPMPERH